MGKTSTATQKARARLKDAETRTLVASNVEERQFVKLQRKLAYMEMLDLEPALNDAQRHFLKEYMDSGILTKALLDSRTPVRKHYEWMRNVEYREIFVELGKFATDRLEGVAVDLATGEYSRPVVSLGKIVAYEQIYDSRLLIKLLEARNPEKFAKKVDITSNGHTLVKFVDKDAWDSV